MTTTPDRVWRHLDTVTLNGVQVVLVERSDLEHRGLTDLNYDYSLSCFLRDASDPDAERIVLHEFLHALLRTDPQRLVPAHTHEDPTGAAQRHEDFVRMLTTGLFDVLGYRRTQVRPTDDDQTAPCPLAATDASGQTMPAPAMTAEGVGRETAGGSSEARLWVDDLRPAPDGWLWAKTSQEAIDALLDESFDVMSLDHDLGGDDTSRRVVLWLCEYGAANWPGEVRVHSANPVGAEWLTGMVERYAPRRPGGAS